MKAEREVSMAISERHKGKEEEKGEHLMSTYMMLSAVLGSLHPVSV